MTNKHESVPEGLFSDVGLEEHVRSSKLSHIHQFPAKAIFHLLVLPPVPREEAHEEYRACTVRRADDGTYEYVDSMRYMAHDWEEALSKAQRFFSKVCEEDTYGSLGEPHRFELSAESNN